MKKGLVTFAILVTFIVALLVFSLFYNPYGYSGWYETEIENVGSIKIPNDLHTEIFDNGIVITDSSSDIYLLGFYTDKEFKYGTDVYTFKDIVSSEMLSNSARFGKCTVEINNEQCERLFLKVYGSGTYDSMLFFAIDEAVDSEIMKKMAKSYKMYYIASS